MELKALPTKEIALQLGFYSQNYFSRAFKNRYSFSPDHYRENHNYS
ncbi:helix-turn-helix domain-containing protein [Candidatus Pelagisphaera phototrophica]|nr:helix-turn-helix domain-containing protein [Candidatus Pelagisphaera phototrophica]